MSYGYEPEATGRGGQALRFVLIELPLGVGLQLERLSAVRNMGVRVIHAYFDIMTHADNRARQIVREPLVTALPGIVGDEIHLNIDLLCHHHVGRWLIHNRGLRANVLAQEKAKAEAGDEEGGSFHGESLCLLSRADSHSHLGSARWPMRPPIISIRFIAFHTEHC